jgi:hypothetical protein
MNSSRMQATLRAGLIGMIAFGALLGAAPASAQSLWAPAGTGPSIHLELLRPDFAETPISFVGATAAGFVTARAPIGPGLTAVAEVPFSRAAWEAEEVEEIGGSATLIGNPYLGVEWQSAGRLGAEFGARLPLGDLEDVEKIGATLVGIASELERMEAFMPETLGLYAATTYRVPLAGPLSLGLRGVSAYLTGDGGPDDLIVSYSGQLRYGTERGAFGAGIIGRANTSSDSLNGGERVSHQVILGGDRAFGAFRPTAQLRFHLDDDVRNVSDLTLGIGLAYSFR